MMLTVLALLVGIAACGDDDEEEAGGQATTTALAPTTTARVTTTAAGVTTTAAGAALVRTASHPQFGTILVDSQGRALYTFDRDTSSTSTCTGGCAETWPPLLLPSGVTSPTGGSGVTGTLAATPRPDGTGSQVTLNGDPLYRYAGDPNPGDVNGDGVGGNWHVAKPA